VLFHQLGLLVTCFFSNAQNPLDTATQHADDGYTRQRSVAIGLLYEEELTRYVACNIYLCSRDPRRTYRYHDIVYVGLFFQPQNFKGSRVCYLFGHQKARRLSASGVSPPTWPPPCALPCSQSSA